MSSDYNSAFKSIENAKFYEQSGQLIEAKKLYVKGIEQFMQVMKLESNTSKKQLIKQHVTTFMQKAESLQNQIKRNNNKNNKNHSNHMFIIAEQYLKEAIEFDENQNYKEAISKYKTASQLLLDGIQNKNNQYSQNMDQITKNKYRQKISNSLDRIEILQHTVQRQHALAKSTVEYKEPIHINQQMPQYIKKVSSFAVIPRMEQQSLHPNKQESNVNKPKYVSKQASFAIIPKYNKHSNDIEHKESIQIKETNPFYIKKASSFAVVPKMKQESFFILPNMEEKSNKIETNPFLCEEKQEYKQYEEHNSYDNEINISDNWSSDEDDINVNELNICYATHFKLIWNSNNNNLNSLHAMIFEPILGENEFMIGHLASNNCANDKLLIIKTGGTDRDAFKPAKCFQCIYSIHGQISFFKAIPSKGYSACGHIALKIECQIGEYVRVKYCPKFMCIKNKYFLSSKLRNIRNIIFESNSFCIYQQANFTQHILSPMFCKYSREKPTENELYMPLNSKYLKKNEKPFYDAIKSGFLHKVCKLKRRKKRYYVLTNENILYSYNINDTLMKEIDLKTMSKCTKIKGNDKGFSIHLNGKYYELEIIEDEQSMYNRDSWMDAIQFGYNRYHNNESKQKPNNYNCIDSEDDLLIDDGHVETKGNDILIINDYTSSKTEVNTFAEKIKDFEQMLMKIENMAETGENQKYAIESYVNLEKIMRSINKLLDKYSQDTCLMYIPSEIMPLRNKTNNLLTRCINIIINDIKWAANANINEYAAARLTAACTICSHLDNGQTIVSQYIIDQLLYDTKTQFIYGSTYSKLMYINRRFAEFRRKMKKYIDIYKQFVPEFWYLENQMAAQFCILTCESLEKQLSMDKETESIDNIVKAKNKCLEFEQELVNRYHIDSSFFPKISDILELHLNFDCEVAAIQQILINSKKKENMNSIKEFLNKINLNASNLSNKAKYLKSFADLYISIHKSIESCKSKSKGEPLMQLILNYLLILEKYASNLSELLYIAGGKSEELKEIIPTLYKSNYHRKLSLMPHFNMNIRSENKNTYKNKIQRFVIYCCLIYNTCIQVRKLIDELLNRCKYLLKKELQNRCKHRMHQTVNCYINVEQLCLDLIRASIMYQFETHLFKELLTNKMQLKRCKTMLLKEFDNYLLNTFHLLRRDIFIHLYTMFCGFFTKSFFDIILGSENINDFEVNTLLDFIEIFQISATHFVSVKCLVRKQYTINKIKYKIENKYMNACKMLIKLLYTNINNNIFKNIVKEIYNNNKQSFQILKHIPSYQLIANSDVEQKEDDDNNYVFRFTSFSPIIPIQIKVYDNMECIQTVMIKRKFNKLFQHQIKRLCQELM